MRASRRRSFSTGTVDNEQRNVSNIPSRNSKANSFQNRRPEFRAKLNFNKAQCIEVIPLVTYWCAILTALKRHLSYRPEDWKD
jgi:hypothetical protein